MDIDIRIDRDVAGGYIAHCPKLPYCISRGASEKEARDNINLLIRDWIETDRILAGSSRSSASGQLRSGGDTLFDR